MTQLQTIKDFLKDLKYKSIHIIGITGSESSSILRLLVKHDIRNITGHDFLAERSIEKSYKLWHKGLKPSLRNQYFDKFRSDLSKITFYSGGDYLKTIDKAEVIFVPQSWRLYKQNKPLWRFKKKKIPFYSINRIYLDFSPAKVVAVTGTLGKGSVVSILLTLLKNSGFKVYFAGNETWTMQLADELEKMKEENILLLEISHRQLQDGFNRAPNMVIFTNLYPNHLDEMSWQEYKRLKLSLLLYQQTNDMAILNYDDSLLRNIAVHLKSKVLYFSKKDINMNTKSVQKLYSIIMNTNVDHYPVNILAACTAAVKLGISTKKITRVIPSLKTLPARLEYVASINKVKIYNDIKSTTPWSTIAAIDKLSSSIILLCGGFCKRIKYQQLARRIEDKTEFVIVLKSELSSVLRRLLPNSFYNLADSLEQAIIIALKRAQKGDVILVSPAASRFYSQFIKGKKSLRKIVTSLLQEGQEKGG